MKMKRKISILLGATLIITTLSGCNVQDYSFDNANKYGKTFTGTLKESIKDDNLVESINGDNVSLIDKYRLPALERMSEEDNKKFVDNLQVMGKIKNLKYDTNKIMYPEKNWKDIYQEVLENADKINYSEIVNFNGSTASELNEFIKNNGGKSVNIQSNSIKLDTTINLTNEIYLKGNGCILSTDKNIEKAIYIENLNNIIIEGFKFDKCSDYGIYIINSSNISLVNNQITELKKKPIVVMGNNNYINIVGNNISNNGHGGIYFNGKIEKSIIDDNTISNNKGTSNWMAGIVLTSIPITDLKNPYKDFDADLHFPKGCKLDKMLECPNQIIVRNNIVEGNNSSGIYSDGAYDNYVIGNSVIHNDKEGLCLDYGTFGTYISENKVYKNGGRKRQTDKDLKNDFVLEAGRMQDGSSKSKLPGISLDNAVYNVLANNHFKNNYGSGVKMVRTSSRNIIMQNNIESNNIGQNEDFHFFGIELGYAAADSESDTMDYTSDYENIINRNTITGSHYAGIFLAEECYINDIFDNVIMDSSVFSMEALTDKQNSSVNNLADKESRGIPLSSSSVTITVPGMVK